MLFNEPKLLKYIAPLKRERGVGVSVLFNEPKLLKYCVIECGYTTLLDVSVLFNEPKLLKSSFAFEFLTILCGFSALQRAEIAEM